jgi:hypothetical protein
MMAKAKHEPDGPLVHVGRLHQRRSPHPITREEAMP